MKRMAACCLMLIVLAGVMRGQGSASLMTKVTLAKLHCMGCAKSIAKELHTIPGVAEVRVDLKTKTMYIVHREAMTPSPRAMWEAIEKADHTPRVMQTPTATYTSRPQT